MKPTLQNPSATGYRHVGVLALAAALVLFVLATVPSLAGPRLGRTAGPAASGAHPAQYAPPANRFRAYRKQGSRSFGAHRYKDRQVYRDRKGRGERGADKHDHGPKDRDQAYKPKDRYGGHKPKDRDHQHKPKDRYGHGDDHEDYRPHRKHRHRHWHVHIPPPIFAVPDTVEDRNRYLGSLPRRQQEAPRVQATRQTAARQILVLVDQSRPQSLGLDLARAYGLERLSSRTISLLGARAEVFRVRGGRSDAAVLAALQRDGRIRSAQFNQRYFHTGDKAQQIATIPQYGPRNVHIHEAHRLALGRKVAIAVIDSAVDTTHPDLEGAVVRSFDAAKGRPAAPDFHGTAVAGIIRSRGLVEGIAPQAEIMAVRAFWSDRPKALPETNTDVLLGAIDWSVSNGARVLNLSFVGPQDAALEAMLEAAGRKHVVVVAAAGNAGPQAAPAYPAAYPGVIAVTAVDEADRRYRHANRGSYIAVAAPGVDVLAPVERGRHSYLSGTSFAAAYVSGIAALLLERDPDLDAPALFKLITAGADDLGPAGPDDDFGAGRVNALGALKSMAGLAKRR